MISQSQKDFLHPLSLPPSLSLQGVESVGTQRKRECEKPTTHRITSLVPRLISQAFIACSMKRIKAWEISLGTRLQNNYHQHNVFPNRTKTGHSSLQTLSRLKGNSSRQHVLAWQGSSCTIGMTLFVASSPA